LALRRGSHQPANTSPAALSSSVNKRTPVGKAVVVGHKRRRFVNSTRTGALLIRQADFLFRIFKKSSFDFGLVESVLFSAAVKVAAGDDCEQCFDGRLARKTLAGTPWG
jgi:hypothetical protein